MENKYGIYTCVIGAEAQEYAKLCLPSQKVYAKDIGASHYVLDENNPNSFEDRKTSAFNILKSMSQRNIQSLIHRDNKFYEYDDFKKELEK